MTTTKLKIIACSAMLIDHIGAVLYGEILILRIIGRIAFPIFAFLIVNGYFHTKDIKKYLTRLGLFAIISEVPFDLAFHNTPFYLLSQNVFFTLFLGLLAVHIFDKNKYERKGMAIFYVALISFISVLLMTDYSIFGILMIFSFYVYKNEPSKQILSLFIINLVIVVIMWSSNGIHLRSSLQIFALLAFIFLYAYNGKKGMGLKYLFYIFYPGHLLLLYFINNMNFRF